VVEHASFDDLGGLGSPLVGDWRRRLFRPGGLGVLVSRRSL
jgi:hypothetical protein